MFLFSLSSTRVLPRPTFLDHAILIHDPTADKLFLTRMSTFVYNICSMFFRRSALGSNVGFP